MTFEFRLPDLGEGVAEGEVVQWFVHEGDLVKEDAPLVSVLTDKANVEIPSPKAGRVVRTHAQVGEKVKVGGLLVSIETEGGSTTATPPAPPAPARPERTAPPSVGVSAATGAAPLPVPSGPAGGAVLASPYLRRLAAERGIDLGRVRGSGPGGRITEADLAAPSTVTTGPAAPAPSVPPAPATVPAARGSGGAPPADAEVSERVPIRGLRRVIADHMAESTHKAAHFTYVEEVDVSELIRVRDRMAKHVEQQGVRLSYLPFVVKGVVAGLRAHPRLNATVDEERNELVLHSTYNIGIATAAPDGLLVPVVHHAETRSILQLSREIQDLAERGRAGKLTRAELSGGTFTITSLGALGGVLATPILNYPEVGILGVHKIFRRPVYGTDGSLRPADLMNLSISLDHRLIDGIEGARFIATVKSYLEDPHQLFAEMA